MIATLKFWWSERDALHTQAKIDKLLIERAGLIEIKAIGEKCGTAYPTVHQHLGEINERLRQLGYKDTP